MEQEGKGALGIITSANKLMGTNTYDIRWQIANGNFKFQLVGNSNGGADVFQKMVASLAGFEAPDISLKISRIDNAFVMFENGVVFSRL